MRPTRPLAACLVAALVTLTFAGGAYAAPVSGGPAKPAAPANGGAAKPAAPVNGGRAKPAAPSRPATDVGGVIAPGTVWGTGGSPYRVTSDVDVPAGVTLTIEPGVQIRMGRARSITVAGSVLAVGTKPSPITVVPDVDGQPWTGWVIEPSATFTRFENVTFEQNGARRVGMLEIRSSDVVVKQCLFKDAGGSAIDVRDASPVIEESQFIRAGALSLIPPGSLRIRGTSEPVVRLNFFQSNPNAPVYQDATASPRYDGNRFEYNGWDGASIAGVVTGTTTLTSLGPHRWSYWVDAGGIVVDAAGSLTIEPGAALRFMSNGLLVRGSLRILGQPGSKVLLSSDDVDPVPGSWRDITFFNTSVPYDPATGGGSMIDHAVIEYGGSQAPGVLQIDGASPRISNVMFRKSPTRGATISGPAAAPLVIGNWFLELNSEDAGEAIVVSAGARPQIAYNVLQDNGAGIDTDSGAMPVIGPFNRFDRNTRWGVINHDSTVCVSATDNEWGAPEGPDDPSPRDDTCALGTNASFGDVVSDNVGYSPWVGTLARPYIVAPRCGTVRTTSPVIEGMAPPGSTVIVYDNYEPLGDTSVGSSPDVLAPFSFETHDLAEGGHVFHVRAQSADESQKSGLSDGVEVLVDPTSFVSASGLHLTYDLDGIHYAMGVADPDGCAAVGSGEWEIRIHPNTQNPNIAATTTLVAPLVCPTAATATLLYNDLSVPMTVTEGVARATFEPGTGGVLGIEVTCGGLKRYVQLGPVSIEYEGFVFDRGGPSEDHHLDRVQGAEVTLFQADPGGSTWSVWDAANTFGQQNPQTTGEFGWYGWYPPPGRYRAEVRDPELGRFVSKPVRITAQPFMLSIGMGSYAAYLPALERK